MQIFIPFSGGRYPPDSPLNNIHNKFTKNIKFQSYSDSMMLKDEDIISFLKIISIIEGEGFADRSFLTTACLILREGRSIVETGGYVKYV